MTAFTPKAYQSQVLDSIEAYFKARARQSPDGLVFWLPT